MKFLVMHGKPSNIVAIVLLQAISVQINAENGSQQGNNHANPEFNPLDIGSILETLAAQFYHASTNDVFPTTLLTLNPSMERFRLDVCSREEITKCMYYGEKPRTTLGA